jgi:ectoine hydroxylase-related dioxygenase (phytanoyl-CoA dioxygenase family)
LARAGAGLVLSRAGAEARALEAMRAAWTCRLRGEDEGEPVFVRKRGNNEGPKRLENEPAFRHCLEHPYVMSAVAELLDGDVALIAFHGRDPHRGSGQQGFHVDSAEPVPPDRQSMANAFWILDDMDESNGATRLIPGSHRLARMPPKGWQRRDARRPEARSIDALAGDVIVFSAHLWHAGAENLSGAPRRIAMARFARREVVESAIAAMGGHAHG